MSAFEKELEKSLAALRSQNLLRNPRVSTRIPGPYFEVDGQRKICLCSNNYLGLASHPELLSAVSAGIPKHGAGAGAARLVSGSQTVHRETERELAAWVGLDDSLLFASGYAANVGALQALVGEDDLIVSDALNHASLIDGCRLSRARVVVVPHCDASAVREALRNYRGVARRALVVTESVFSMDGDSPDLVALRSICDEFDAGFYVDEAHALGVFGPKGSGMCALFHVKPDVLMGTLGKSLGLSGAFVSGSEAVRSTLQNHARSYVFSTGISPAIADGARVAMALAMAADGPRATLQQHATRLREQVSKLGFRIPTGTSPIIPVLIGAPDAALAVSSALWDRGVFVQAIRPPTVPVGSSRLRVVPIATHSEKDIDDALSAFREAVK